MAGLSSLKKLVDIRQKKSSVLKRSWRDFFNDASSWKRNWKASGKRLYHMAQDPSVQRLRLEFERRNVLRKEEVRLLEEIRKLDQETIPPSRDRATRAEQQVRMVELLLERKKKELIKEEFRQETKQLDEAGRSRWLRNRKPES